MKINSTDIELAVSAYFGYRQNLIVPNISWGLWIHECDLLVVTKAGYAIEIEIKISRADIKKDALKRHGHVDKRLKCLYFAIPEKLKSCIDLIPERAGVFIVKEKRPGWLICNLERKPVLNKEARKLTPEEQFKVAHLGAMRIWELKHTIKHYCRKNNETLAEKEKGEGAVIAMNEKEKGDGWQK